MQVLEKILEEINRLDDPYFVGYIERYKVKEIIRSHMNDDADTNVAESHHPEKTTATGMEHIMSRFTEVK